jgi:hypothetical protein
MDGTRHGDVVSYFNPRLPHWPNLLTYQWVYAYFSRQLLFLFFIVAANFVTVSAIGMWGHWAGVFALGVMLVVLNVLWTDDPSPPASNITEL